MVERKKKGAGFTLVEILISIFVIGLLSSMILVNYRSGEKEQAVALEAETLVNNLRDVQNRAIHGVKNDSEVPYGYGIYIKSSFSNTTYKIFADNNNDQDYQPSEVIETITLDDNVLIQSSSPSTLSILFQPPFGTMYINGVNSVSGNASIVLQNKSGSITKTIIVNNLGHGIYIQ